MVSAVIHCFIFILFSFTVRVKSQFCPGINQYDRCSLNSACACFHIAGAIDVGICSDEFVDCSELVACESSNNLCREPNHRCVHHPQCHNRPVCYPVPSFNRQLCPPRAIIPNIPADARWAQNGVTVAGGHGAGRATNQLSWPFGLFVDDDQTIVIADWGNERIIQWKMDDTNGQVVAGGNGQGNRLDQLDRPTDVLIDKQTVSLIICDLENRQVVRWSRRSGTTQGEILINNIKCSGLAMDDQRYLYISDYEKHEVRRYETGEKNGTIVAGGNGEGAGLSQLNSSTYILVDQQHTAYVSDNNNHRVMKWNKGAKEGIVVAGGQGEGNALTQLPYPNGLHTINNNDEEDLFHLFMMKKITTMKLGEQSILNRFLAIKTTIAGQSVVTVVLKRKHLDAQEIYMGSQNHHLQPVVIIDCLGMLASDMLI
ncbi:unnamed protein product [Rotaria sordida]|uniref:Uncharacterized protein n=1 Tax=Rotaria sordida TaxID=392033 RepID=A0A815E6V3_9BILA|nr:unnamed protein product [Rotaria sordida]